MCSICYCVSPISLFIATSVTNFNCKCYLQQLLLCYGIPLVLKWYLQYSFIYSLSLFLHVSRQIQCYKVCWSSIHFFFSRKARQRNAAGHNSLPKQRGYPRRLWRRPWSWNQDYGDPGVGRMGENVIITKPISVAFILCCKGAKMFVSLRA